MSEHTDSETRRRRLLFRATHRGTKEGDLMLGGFVSRHLQTFSDAELDVLEVLMELPDVDLADWVSGRRPIPADADPMLHRIAADVLAAPRPGQVLPESRG